MTPDWKKIRREYERGGISQRKLAEKHGVSYNTMKDRAKRENWSCLRNEEHSRITAITQQKTAEKVSDALSDEAAAISEMRAMAATAVAARMRNVLDGDARGSELKNLLECVRMLKEMHDADQDGSRSDDVLKAYLTAMEGFANADAQAE